MAWLDPFDLRPLRVAQCVMQSLIMGVSLPWLPSTKPSIRWRSLTHCHKNDGFLIRTVLNHDLLVPAILNTSSSMTRHVKLILSIRLSVSICQRLLQRYLSVSPCLYAAQHCWPDMVLDDPRSWCYWESNVFQHCSLSLLLRFNWCCGSIFVFN